MTLASGELWRIDTGDCRELLRQMPAACVQCCVTSTPYYGQRDYKVPPTDWPAVEYSTVGGRVSVPALTCCLGMEPSPAAFVGHLVLVFGEVRRVLRDDGTLWLNLGDSYAASGMGGNPDESAHRKQATNAGSLIRGRKAPAGLKPKDLLGIPWLVAFALRDAGWYLRSEIIWAKRSPMPESVTDRPTKAHEQVFLLAKRASYFYDAVASGETAKHAGKPIKTADGWDTAPGAHGTIHRQGREKGKQSGALQPEIRNLRSVWTLSNEPFPGAHFATMPTRLVEPCIKAGSSEHGQCPVCGSAWRRMVSKDRRPTRPGVNTKCTVKNDGDSATAEANGWNRPNVIGNRDPRRHCTVTETVGWGPSCGCGAGDPVPQVVLDPFAGAGTVPMVARRLGRRAYGCELNGEYAALARARVAGDMPLFNTPAGGA